MQAPWTEIGRLQQDVSRLESDIRNKADKHEIPQTQRDVSRLEDSVREIRANLDELRFRIEGFESRLVALEHGDA